MPQAVGRAFFHTYSPKIRSSERSHRAKCMFDRRGQGMAEPAAVVLPDIAAECCGCTVS